MKHVLCSSTPLLSIGLLSIVSTQACLTPEDPYGTYAKLAGDEDEKNAIWTLRCNVGYALADASQGVLKRCDGYGGFYEPIATTCQAKPGCRKDQLEKLIGDDTSKPNDCNQTMQEGSTCSAICPSDYDLIGYFMCSEGEIIGESGCLMDGELTMQQATGFASTYTMSLTNCNEGYAATSCASILKDQIGITLNTRMLRVDVQDANGRYISSTSKSTFDAGTTTTAAPPGRLLSSGVYDVRVEAVVFPQDAVGTQSLSELTAEIMVNMQDLGTTGSQHSNTLKQKLGSTSPAINVQSSQVKVAPRHFATTIAVEKVKGTIANADALPAPVFPSTTAAPKDDFEVPLWMVIALSTGAVIGACVVLSLIGYRRWRHERACNS